MSDLGLGKEGDWLSGHTEDGRNGVPLPGLPISLIVESLWVPYLCREGLGLKELCS